MHHGAFKTDAPHSAAALGHTYWLLVFHTSLPCDSQNQSKHNKTNFLCIGDNYIIYLFFDLKSRLSIYIKINAFICFNKYDLDFCLCIIQNGQT